MNPTAWRSMQIFKDYEAQRMDWAKKAANNEDFFMGRQWTSAELTQLKERGMAPIVVNRTHPVIMQEVAILTAKRPSFRYYGRDDSDTAIASMWSDAVAWVWDESQGDLQHNQSIQDMLVTGAGYFAAYIDGYADDGNGEVRFCSLSPYDVYPDPNSRELDLSDARAIIVSRIVDTEQLSHLYPDKSAKIRSASTENGPTSDRPLGNPRGRENGIASSDYDFYGTVQQRRKVRVIELYEKIKVPHYKVIHYKTGYVEVLTEAEYNSANYGNDVDVVRVWRDMVHLTITIGNYTTLFEGMLPTPIYPIVPLFLHHARNPYPQGDVDIVMGMQIEINKRRSIMIHNATLSGNHRWVAEQGSIVDKENWERHGTRAGSVLEYRASSSGQGPREVLPQPLPAAFIQLEAEAKADLEYAVSVFSHMMGSNQDAPETYRGLLALEEAGQRKIQHKAAHARLALRRLGKVLFYYMRHVYTQPKVLRIVGENNEDYREIWMNAAAVDPQSGQVSTWNSTQVGEYDLVVVDGSSMPTNRMALLNLYLEMYQLGIVDKQEVLNKTDVVNKKAVLERMGEIAQLSAQVEQAGETIKDLQGLNQTLRRQLQQSEVQQGVQQATEGIREELMQTTLAQQLTRQRMQDELSILKRRGELAVASSKIAAGAFAAQTKVQAFMEREKARLDAKAQKAKATSEAE